MFKFEAEIEGRHIVAEIQEKEQVGHSLSDDDGGALCMYRRRYKIDILRTKREREPRY